VVRRITDMAKGGGWESRGRCAIVSVVRAMYRSCAHSCRSGISEDIVDLLLAVGSCSV